MTRKKNPAMSLSIRLTLLAPICLATLLAGCMTPNAPVIQRNADATYGAAQAGNAGSLPAAAAPGASAAVDVAPAKASTASIKTGTGQVVNERGAASPPRSALPATWFPC